MADDQINPADFQDFVMAQCLSARAFMLSVSVELARMQPDPLKWTSKFISTLHARIDVHERSLDRSLCGCRCTRWRGKSSTFWASAWKIGSMSKQLKPCCPDCGAPIGDRHRAGCDIERCPHCGWQALGCLGFDANDARRWAWNGKWPGEDDCERLGFFVNGDPDFPT
jgi:hypothetical protein